MEIDVILPCLNEAGALPWLLSRMPAGYRPIVADNGSDDGSPTIAADHGATVVHVPRRGYGAACHAGLEAAKADIVCFMDADGSLDPADLPSVAGLVLNDGADLALGRRRPPPRSGNPGARHRPDGGAPPARPAGPADLRPPVRLPAGDRGPGGRSGLGGARPARSGSPQNRAIKGAWDGG